MTDSKTVAVLVRAREYVAQSWANVSGVRFGDPQARATCAWLALRRADSGPTGREAERVFKRAVDCESVTDWNDEDDRTHEQVLEGFSRAIELARKEEGK